MSIDLTGLVRKDDTDELTKELLGQIDMSGWAILIDPMAKEIGTVMSESGKALLAEIGLGADDKAFQIVDRAALEFARTRAAELVGRRILEDGSIVENPDAAWAITEGTRTMLSSTVRDALENGWAPGQLREAIMSNYAFSSQRALNVARTETARAHGLGGFEAAQASGLIESKEALLGSEHGDDDEDECDDNVADGVIPVDQDFSGSAGPVAEGTHPSCVCTTIYHAKDEGAEKLLKINENHDPKTGEFSTGAHANATHEEQGPTNRVSQQSDWQHVLSESAPADFPMPFNHEGSALERYENLSPKGQALATQMTPQQFMAVDTYIYSSTSEGEKLNAVLRSGGELSDEQAQLLGDVKGGLSSLPALEGTTYRGMMFHGTPNEWKDGAAEQAKAIAARDEWMSQYKSGDVMSEKGFGSSSESQGVAKRFATSGAPEKGERTITGNYELHAGTLTDAEEQEILANRPAGTRVNRLPRMLLNDETDTRGPGYEIKEPSVTRPYDPALDAPGDSGVMLKISGKSGRAISALQDANLRGEKEVLFMPNTRFRVDKIAGFGKRLATMEVTEL